MPLNHRAAHGKLKKHGKSKPMVCCQAGSAQVVQQASVHSIEGGTEKLLALTVHVQWQRASIGSRTPTGPERGMVAMSVVQLSGSFRVCCLAVSVNDC